MESLLLPISFPTTNETADNGYSTFALPKSETAAAKTNRGEYMRQYMAKKYKQNPQAARKYRNTCRARTINNELLSEDDIMKYGIHLADILKLKKLFQPFQKSLPKN